MSIQESMKEGWYLLKAKPRREQSASDNLENQGFDAYCPSIASKGSSLKEEILFPGYIFLSLDVKDLDRYHKIRSTRGVSEIVRFNRITRKLFADGRISVKGSDLHHLLPQPIPCGETMIQQIKDMVQFLQNGRAEGKNLFAKGDNVTICNPLYEHLKATFIKGISVDRGLILIQYIKQQRNEEGAIEQTLMPVRTMTVKLGDLKKEGAHQQS